MRFVLVILIFWAGMASETMAEEKAGKKGIAKQKGVPQRALPEKEDEVLLNFRKKEATPKQRANTSGPVASTSRSAGKKKGKK